MTVDEFNKLKYGPDRHNIRILAPNLIAVCRYATVHGSVIVEACGSLYATLALTDEQIASISHHNISWSRD